MKTKFRSTDIIHNNDNISQHQAKLSSRLESYVWENRFIHLGVNISPSSISTLSNFELIANLLKKLVSEKVVLYSATYDSSVLFSFLVGKTSLITRFMYDSFDSTYQVYCTSLSCVVCFILLIVSENCKFIPSTFCIILGLRLLLMIRN